MKKRAVFLAVLLLSNQVVTQQNYSFPRDFKFGVATSAYQVEGAWDEEDKGESIWDRLTHTRPDKIADGSNGDVACDAYNKVEEDVKLLKDMNVDFYKFSISWSRILPTGYTKVINADGIRYYNELIDELISSGIRPCATMYHWDLPQPLQIIGGWMNEEVVTAFEAYADLLYSLFGNRVKDWVTFDDPFKFCFEAYFHDTFATGLKTEGATGYSCAHTVLKSHARAYRLYDTRYRGRQHGRVGIALGAMWMEPALRTAPDLEASDIAMEIELGWFAHPIFSKSGNYPAIVNRRLELFVLQEQLTKFKLPQFDSEEIEYIKGSADFFGLNHFTTRLCTTALTNKNDNSNVNWVDIDYCIVNDTWESSASAWLKVVPWGLRKILNWIRIQYNNPEVVITGNGYSDRGEINDCHRVHYHNSYLEQLLLAIREDSCNVSAYTVWSFMDNFQWFQGYSEKFGLYSVDFATPERVRSPKLSSATYANVIKTRKVDWDFNPQGFKLCKWGFNFTTVVKA